MCLVHSVRMALAGERIVVLDRENGADEYADRLAQIMNSWKLTEAQRSTLDATSYYEYPTLKPNDAADSCAIWTKSSPRTWSYSTASACSSRTTG